MKDMSYEVFCNYMQEKLQQYYGVETNVKLQCVQKVNGVLLRGITVFREKQHIVPTLYLEHFFDEYESGKPIQEVIHAFIAEYDKACIYEDFDISFYEEYEKVKPHLGFKIINYEMNWQLLQSVPHKCYLDFAIVCYCDIADDRIGKGSILVRNEHVKMWKISEERVLADSMKNMQRMMPAELLNMSDVLKDLYDDPAGLIITKHPMYVLTNKGRVFGAGCLLYEGLPERIADEVQDDFYLLPSSIHEFIILPKRYAADEAYLSQMVNEINHEKLEREEILSNHAYLYSNLTKEVTLLPLFPYKK